MFNKAFLLCELGLDAMQVKTFILYTLFWNVVAIIAQAILISLVIKFFSYTASRKFTGRSVRISGRPFQKSF